MGEAMEQLLAAVEALEAVEGATAANSTLGLCAQTSVASMSSGVRW